MSSTLRNGDPLDPNKYKNLNLKFMPLLWKGDQKDYDYADKVDRLKLAQVSISGTTKQMGRNKFMALPTKKIGAENP